MAPRIITLVSTLQEVIDATSDASDDCNTITYTLSGFSNLLELEVFQMVHSDIRMKRCKNCGKAHLRSLKGKYSDNSCDYGEYQSADACDGICEHDNE